MILVIWGEGSFKICGDEIILDILELQMKSKKKGLMRIYINNFETYTRYSEVADEKIVLGGELHFLKVAI